MILLLMLIPSLLFAVNLPTQGTPAKYIKTNQYLIRHVSTDAKQLYRSEIGSRNANEFIPKVTVASWGECEFSIEIPKLPGASCEWDGDTLLYGNNNVQCKFYEKTDENGYGSMEYEVVFQRKPQNNTWTFNINMQDVVVYYQYPLTEEEKAMTNESGSPVYWQDDRHAGSYAIYKASQFKNITGETIYGFGKVGHLWRPKIIGANNEEAWCDMYIDTNTMTLTVTIPLQFFNNAALPWRLDPEIGYNPGSSGTPGSSVSLENVYHGHATVASSAGDVDFIKAYTYASSINKDVKMAIYVHDTGNVLTNSESSVYSSSSSWAWKYHEYSTKPSISSGTEYIVGALGYSGSSSHTIGRDSASGEHYSAMTYPTFASSVLWSTNVFRIWAYASYTESGGGGGATGGGKTNSSILIME